MLKVRLRFGRGNERLDKQLREIISGDLTLSIVKKDDVANLMISDCLVTLTEESTGSIVKVLVVRDESEKTDGLEGIQTLTPGETIERVSRLSAA